MTKPILIVEDDKMQQQMLAMLLKRKLGYESDIAENGREALDILEQDESQITKLVILDLHMPIMDGMETLEIMSQRYPALPVVMLTGSKDISDAVKAMKLGATDFLSKPYEGDRMMITIKNALKISTLSKEVTRLKSEQEGTFKFKNLMGAETGLQHATQIGRKAAASDIPVLITGETGTGKEVFAKAIHGESLRANKPFIAVNCGAIPAQLVESTLFGHEKGAFTGATEKVIGKFREAEGGTIFLDEVGELPLDTQVKLLRVLQQKEVEPVGAGKPISINVRIVSATNRDLQDEVNQGHFREDLYFRLNVLQIHLPPLRDRKQDISQLTRHFIERFAANGNLPLKDLTAEAEQQLHHYDWPGNIRQLENTIHRALVVNDQDHLDTQDFNTLLKMSTNSNTTPEHQSSTPISTAQSIGLLNTDKTVKTMDDIEHEAITLVLAHHNQNITKAAQSLNIAKSTFYKKIAKYGIET